ncbi:MAG TPA: DUF4824 family protein [Thermoanaerobaculia bacterium]|nr:DUF4824 family protein [Thermoanaerobaculia bacterium]
MKGLAAGLALIAVVNAVALAGVAWNRRGEPDATVTLTERELQIPWHALNDQEEEDTGLDLQLEWRARWSTARGEGLPAATLRELGFRLDPGRHEPPRSAWLVMEMDGEAWRRQIEERRREVEKERREKPDSDCPPGSDLEEMLVSGSRLVVVEAGKDRDALRRRHPDRSRFLIVPGRVDAREVSPGVFEGAVAELGVGSIHVPLQLRPVLDEIVSAERLRRGMDSYVATTPGPPRFRATVAFGRRGEPWLVNVEKLPAPPPGFASAPRPALPGGCSG